MDADLPDSESELVSRLANATDPGSLVSEQAPADGQPPEGGNEDVQEEVSDAEPLAELEHLGKKYNVPESLKNAFEANRAQGTRATQEVAEVRRGLVLERQAVEIENRFRSESQQEFTDLAKIEAQIEQFKNVDWAGLDTDQLVRTRHALDTLKERRYEAQQKLAAKRDQFQSQLKDSMDKLRAYGLERLTKSIPGWGDSTALDVAKYASAKGFTEEEIRSMYDPRAVEVLYEAMQWRKLQASKPQLAQKVKDPVIKPGPAASNQMARAKEDQQALRQKLKKSGDYRDAAAWLLSVTK